jgi:hypothetical protein
MTEEKNYNESEISKAELASYGLGQLNSTETNMKISDVSEGVSGHVNELLQNVENQKWIEKRIKLFTPLQAELSI